MRWEPERNALEVGDAQDDLGRRMPSLPSSLAAVLVEPVQGGNDLPAPEPGQPRVFLMVGVNGAGKTTLMRAALGLMPFSLT